MPRAFIAIDISETLRQKLTEIQNQLKEVGGDLKLVESQNIHLTIRYLGEIPDKKVDETTGAINKAVVGTKKFNLEVKKIGAFPNLNYVRVIWAGVERGVDEVTALQKKIEKELQQIGFQAESGFVPHLTIARVRSAKNKEKLVKFIEEKKSIYFGTTPVSAVELKKSTLTPKGPIYDTLARIELES
ncbi:MAG: RNA 2',3'-cyclic phosphodiesterase [Candidatus Hadarchaeaceae archaeon]